MSGWVNATLDDLLEWAEHTLGGGITPTDRSWPHDDSLVLELVDSRGNRWFLKHPRGRLYFERELHAYETLLEPLGDSVARLVGANPEFRTLLLTAIPGEVVSASERSTDPEIHRRAGEWLARLHSLAPAEPCPDLVERTVAYRDDLLDRVAGLIDPEELDLLVRRSAGLIPTVGAPTVMCHGDFALRNWLVDELGAVRVIDFAFSNRNVAVRDLEFVAALTWAKNPELKAAFLAGYGPIDAAEEATLGAAVLMVRTGRLVNAHERSDRVAARRGLRMLRKALAEAAQA